MLHNCPFDEPAYDCHFDDSLIPTHSAKLGNGRDVVPPKTIEIRSRNSRVHFDIDGPSVIGVSSASEENKSNIWYSWHDITTFGQHSSTDEFRFNPSTASRNYVRRMVFTHNACKEMNAEDELYLAALSKKYSKEAKENARKSALQLRKEIRRKKRRRQQIDDFSVSEIFPDEVATNCLDAITDLLENVSSVLCLPWKRSAQKSGPTSNDSGRARNNEMANFCARIVPA